MQPYHKAIIVISIFFIVGFILKKIRKAERKNSIDEANQFTKKQKEYFRGKPFKNEFINWYDDEEVRQN